MTPRSLLVLLLAFAPAAVDAQIKTTPRAAAQANDPFFDDSVVHTIQLTVNTKDWQMLKDLKDDTYYPADFRWGTQVVRNVGIRSRGTASRSSVKPGLKLDFNRYTSDQTFLGLKSVVLRNNVMEPAFINERLTMLLYGRLGVPAPREAPAKLYVNGEYAGLYTIVESVDKNFLKEWYGENDGYLYEFTWSGAPYYFEPRDANDYVPLPFDPKTHEDSPRPEVIEQMVWAINESSEAAFRTTIAEYLDVEKFIRHVAVEQFVGDRDGFLGTRGMANFDVYRAKNESLFKFIPWDKSEAFKDGPDRDVFYNITGVPTSQQNRLMTRLLSYPDLYNVFLAALDECAEAIGPTTPGAAGWLESEIEREYQQIHDAALADPYKPYTNDEFERAVDGLRDFARARAGVVTSQVSTAAAAAPTGRR
jgi:spore coat protein H